MLFRSLRDNLIALLMGGECSRRNERIQKKWQEDSDVLQEIGGFSEWFNLQNGH